MANRNIFICLQKGSSSWAFNGACLKYFVVNNRLKGNSPRDWNEGLYPTRIRKSPSYLKCTYAWLGDRYLYLSSDLLLFPNTNQQFKGLAPIYDSFCSRNYLDKDIWPSLLPYSTIHIFFSTPFSNLNTRLNDLSCQVFVRISHVQISH